MPEASLTTEVSWDFGEWGLDRDGFLAPPPRRRSRTTACSVTCRPSPAPSDALWRLSDAGVWIRIITHRLVTNWGHALIVSDTVEWLDDQRIPYRDLCFLGRKPEVQADAYVEDAPHNIEALRASGNTVIVFDQPYNRDLDGPRAATWAEVESIVARAGDRPSGALPRPAPGPRRRRRAPRPPALGVSGRRSGPGAS